MSFLRSIFGYRTDRAASGSLSVAQWLRALVAFRLNLNAAHGLDVVACDVRNTNSMLPCFDSNAVLLAEKVPFDALREGDIVTYHSRRGGLIVHRLNEKRPAGWWSVGDNNRVIDPELVTPANFDRRICAVFYGAKDATTDN